MLYTWNYIAHQLYLNLKTLIFQKNTSIISGEMKKKSLSWESGYVEQVEKIKIGS